MLYHFEQGITLTITACKRLQYFRNTIDTFIDKCADYSLITRTIVYDDSSSEADRDTMIKEYPNFEFHWDNRGHVNSIQSLFKMIRTEYFFHLEDDRPMIRKMKLMDLCLKIMNNDNIDSFICGLRIGHETNEIKQLDKEQYYIHKFKKDNRFYSDWKLGNTSWPGFYLAPGMHRTASIMSVPYELVKEHERAYALKYQEAGFKVAFNAGPHIFNHLTEISAYDITKANR